MAETHDSRQSLVIGVVSVFIVVVTTFMFLRIVIRGFVLKGWGIDDYAYVWSCVSIQDRVVVVLSDTDQNQVVCLAQASVVLLSTHESPALLIPTLAYTS